MFAEPSGWVTSATSGANAPSAPARSMASTGIIVMKMPAKSFATSTIGPQEKPLASRYSGLVSAIEATATRDEDRVAQQVLQLDLDMPDR